MSKVRDMWLFARSLFWRSEEYPCRGPIFDDPQDALVFTKSIPSRELIGAPYVYRCAEGHWHGHVVRRHLPGPPSECPACQCLLVCVDGKHTCPAPPEAPQ